MAKRKVAKFPKRLAGVKLPKAVRRAARPLAGVARDPLGRQVLAGLVVAAAIGAWRDERVRAAAAKVGAQARALAERVGDEIKSVADGDAPAAPRRRMRASAEERPAH